MSDSYRPPIGRPFPMVRPGRMHINARLFRHRKKLIEFGQTFRPQDTRLGIKGTERQKDTHTIDSHLAHPPKIFARRFRVKLLPDLRRPTCAWAVIIHSERDERFSFCRREGPPIISNADFGQSRIGCAVSCMNLDRSIAEDQKAHKKKRINGLLAPPQRAAVSEKRRTHAAFTELGGRGGTWLYKHVIPNGASPDSPIEYTCKVQQLAGALAATVQGRKSFEQLLP